MSDEQKERKLPQFDPDYSSRHEVNRDAAKAHNLRWDAARRAYVDADGCLIRDRFGQRY